MADRKAAPSPAAHDTDDASLMLVTFACADARVGLEAQRVRSSRRIPVDAQPPAPTLSALLGLPAPAPMSQPFCLELKSGEGSVEVLVEGPVELVALSARQVFPLPGLIAATSRVRGLRALGLTEAGIVLLVGL